MGSRQTAVAFFAKHMSLSSFLRRLFPSGPVRYSAPEILRWLWQALKGNRLQAVLNALLGVVGVAFSLCSVWAMQRAIDIAASGQGNLYFAVLLMAVLIIGELTIRVAKVWMRDIFGVKAQNRMQQIIIDRLLRSEWRGKEKYHSGDIMNRLETDVVTVVTFVTETLPNTLSVLLMFIGAFLYLMHMDAMLAIVTVAILPVFLLVSRVYVFRMRRLTREVRRSDSEVQSLLQETVQNRMLIKTLDADDMVVGRLTSTHARLRSHVRRRTRFSVFSYVMLSLGFSLGYLVAFLWGAVRLSAGTLTFGGMAAFLQLVFRIQNPARDLTRLVPLFVSVFTAAERLMEIDDMPAEEQGEPTVFDAPCGVRLTNVSYTYDDASEPVINSLSYDFRPATSTAILGETGIGKTTLLRLILALLRPSEGSIEIYNSTTTESVAPRLRCNLVYVPQGNTLLSGTIRDNLLLGDPHASEERLRQVLSMSCADFVFDMPDGIDTLLSEDGGGLSEGQAQRIAIARALLRPGSIMLFDEATSALDPSTEQRLLANILSESKKTIIFITHRPAVVDYCDGVLRLGRQFLTQS